MFKALFLYLLMFVGFIGVGWITNSFFASFRKQQEEGRFDRFGAVVLWGTLFTAYSYFMAYWLH